MTTRFRALRSHPAVGLAMLAAGALLAAEVPGCAVLDPLDAECGNGVLDPGEDCDGNFPDQAVPCREPAGQPDACRYDCAGTGTCPAGFGCGADDVCRRPSGAVGESVGPLGGRTFDIMPSDVDADRFADLLHVGVEGLVGLYFFDEAAQVEAEVGLPSFTAPAFADLTGDGIVDIAMPVRNGPQDGSIVVLLGTGNRDFAAQSYSVFQESQAQYYDRVEALDGVGSLARDELLVFAGALALGYDLEPVQQSYVLVNPPFQSTDLAGFAARDFLVGPDSPCDEVVVVKAGEPTAFVMSPCRGIGGTAWNVKNEAGQIALPEVGLGGSTVRQGRTLDYGLVVDTGVLPAHLDDDETIDLIVAVEPPNLGIAFGTGAGTFVNDVGASNQVTIFDEAAFYKIPCGETPAGFPLATGSLDDGPISFLVARDGIYLGSIENARPVFSAALCTAKTWVEAVVGDFNGDNHADVAAIDEVTPAIDFFAGAGDGAFTFYVVPTFGRARRLRRADVDGDFIDDLVFMVAGDEPDEDLTVAYGAPLVGLTSPEPITTFSEVRQVTSGRLVGSDAAADIFVLTGTPDAIETTLLFGSSDRFLQAPYTLRLSGEEPSARLAATGQFDDDPTREELAVLTRSTVDGAASGPYRLWLLRFDEVGEITAIAGPPLELTGLADARMAAIDVEGDGLDEVALINDDSVTIFRWQDTLFVPETLEFPEALGLDGPGALRVGDVDGDGADDVFFASPRGVVYILWNEAGFDPARGLTLRGDGSLTEVSLGLEGAGPLRAVTSLNFDGEGGGDVLVTTDGAAYHIPLDGRQPAVAIELPGVAGGRALGAADVDGNGVEDLVVGTSVGFRVYPAIPREPGE